MGRASRGIQDCFLEREKYIGQYRVPERPARITSSSILFDFRSEDGNAIACDGDNLPDSVLLDGEDETFFK